MLSWVEYEKSFITLVFIGLDKQKNSVENCKYFLNHDF